MLSVNVAPVKSTFSILSSFAAKSLPSSAPATVPTTSTKSLPSPPSMFASPARFVAFSVKLSRWLSTISCVPSANVYVCTFWSALKVEPVEPVVTTSLMNTA